MSKRDKIVVAHQGDVIESVLGMLREQGFIVAGLDDLPRVVGELLDALAEQGTDPDFQEPHVEAPLPLRVIEVDVQPTEPVVGELGVDDSMVPQSDGGTWDFDLDAMSADPMTMSTDRGEGRMEIDADRFVSDVQSMAQRAAGRLHFNEKTQRYEGPAIKPVPGGGLAAAVARSNAGLPTDTLAKSSELTPLDEQRRILGRVLGRPQPSQAELDKRAGWDTTTTNQGAATAARRLAQQQGNRR